MSPAAVTIGAATLSRSRLRSRAERGDGDRDHEHDDRRDDRADHRDDHEVDDRDRRRRCTNAADTALASTASTAEIDSESRIAAADVLPEQRCRPRRDTRNVPAWICVPRRLPSAAEDVAAHPDRGRDQDEQSRERGERVGDRGEREAGDEIAARRDQEREETRPDSGEVRAYERDEARADETRETKQDELGGSDIRNHLQGSPSRLPRGVTDVDAVELGDVVVEDARCGRARRGARRARRAAPDCAATSRRCAGSRSPTSAARGSSGRRCGTRPSRPGT